MLFDSTVCCSASTWSSLKVFFFVIGVVGVCEFTGGYYTLSNILKASEFFFFL